MFKTMTDDRLKRPDRSAASMDAVDAATEEVFGRS